MEVLPDPRIPYDESLARAKYKLVKDFESVSEKASKAFGFIRDSKKQLKALEGIKAFQQDSIKKELEKWTKPIGVKLDSLEQLFLLPEDTKGIAYDDDKIGSKIQNAQSYLSTSDGTLSENTGHAVNEAKNAVDSIVESLKMFELKSWKPYQEMLTGLPITLFPEPKKWD